jgi:hypothetical protein
MPPATNSPPVSSYPSGEDDPTKQSTADSRHTTQKRNRAQLSCTNCRQTKLKCDRKEPCSQCIKKGKESQCVIPRPVPRRKPAVSMQNRLKHLESLVKGAMSGQNGSQSPDISSPDTNVQMSSRSRDIGVANSNAPETSSGKVLVDHNETTYVGATHWAAILEDVCDSQVS